jgi:3-hydroxy-9,10-secoandrosta-1,3,5(10)-triene-9,17-dione monooxygenase reductase component
VAVRFAASDAHERFRDFKVVDGPMGNPLLPAALAWLECKIESVFPGGDHSIILGKVLACDARDGDPLLFFRGALVGWVP